MSAPRCRPVPLAARLLAGLLLPPAAAVAEPVWREAVWVSPAGAGAAIPGLLSVPSGWQPGDAAALLLPAGPAPDPLRHRVAEALLAAEAAVLDLDPQAAGRHVPGLPPRPGLQPDEVRPALAAAAGVLRQEVGAGLTVVIGFGLAGDAALAAAEGSAAGAPAPGFAAAAALGGTGPARFRAGVPPPAAQAWPRRAPLLCDLLAQPAAEPEARQRCTRALLGPPTGPLWEPPLLAARGR